MVPTRLVRRFFVSLFACGLFGTVRAENDSAGSSSVILSAEGQSLRDRAKAQNSAAESVHAAEVAECYKKFLAASCLDAAKKKLRKAQGEARQLDLQGSKLQHEARMQEKAERERKRIEEAPKNEADAAARKQEFEERRARKEEKLKANQRDEEERIVEARKRLAEKEASRQAKLKAAAGRRPSASPIDREQEYAERAAKIAARKKNYAEELRQREADKARQQAEAEAARRKKESQNSITWPAFLTGSGNR
jgi:hypothetical protein